MKRYLLKRVLVLIFLLLFFSSPVFAGEKDWSKLDKSLFATTAVLQIVDGFSTCHVLKDRENCIDDVWR